MNRIICRYLNKEVLFALLAVTLVLLAIIVTGRISRYLTYAAQGSLNPDALFWLVWYRLPEFLQLILPLGLFLGILLGLGRLYVDHEMTVLSACGVSTRQLLCDIAWVVLPVAIVVGMLSLWVTPDSSFRLESLWKQQKNTNNEFEALVPGRFQTQANETRVVYTEALSDDKKTLNNIFIAQKKLDEKSAKNNTKTKNSMQNSLMIIVAENGEQATQEETDSRFLILKNGYRYDIAPGQLDYRLMQFEEYGIKIGDRPSAESINSVAIKSTAELWESSARKDQAELQWRISLPILVMVVGLLAIPLSRVRPRQGRFVKLLPAFVVYLLYVMLLVGMRSALIKEKISTPFGFWGIHSIFFVLAVLLFYQDTLIQRGRQIMFKNNQVASL